jgi:hypothetical protein
MRYRFRTLLIAITLIACALAIGAHYYRRYRAIDLVFQSGAHLSYEKQVPLKESGHWSKSFSRVDSIIAEDELNDQRLQEALKELPEVKRLHLRAESPSDQSATAIGKLSELRELDLSYHWIEPEQLEEICKSQSLELIVTQRPLSTPHFEALGKSKSLQKISIASSGVTDAQLRCLIEIPSLHFLWFSASDLKGPSRNPPSKHFLQNTPI